MLIKLFITLFVLFAVSRVYLRFRDGSMGFVGMIGWSLLWIGVEIFVWLPKVSDVFAHKIGIGRGVDALVYFSIVGLFYGIFRLYVKMEYIEHEITDLVRKLALDNNGRKTPIGDLSDKKQ